MLWLPDPAERAGDHTLLLLSRMGGHQPIRKVRTYEKADKFIVGTKGNKSSKFVEAAQGTNLYFAVYESEIMDAKSGELVKKRKYATIPLNVVIERLKQNLSPVPIDENGNEPIFVLSPNDLVYVPRKDELSIKFYD